MVKRIRKKAKNLNRSLKQICIDYEPGLEVGLTRRTKVYERSRDKYNNIEARPLRSADPHLYFFNLC